LYRPRVLGSSRPQPAAAGGGWVPVSNRSCLSCLCVCLGPGGAHGGTPLGASEGVLGGRVRATVRAKGHPWGGARWREVLGRGAAVVSSRPAGRASGGSQGRGCDRGGQACAGGRVGAHARSLWASPGRSRGPDGALRQALGDSAGQGVPGACGPGRAGAGRLGSLVRAGPGRACQILVGIWALSLL